MRELSRCDRRLDAIKDELIILESVQKIIFDHDKRKYFQEKPKQVPHHHNLALLLVALTMSD